MEKQRLSNARLEAYLSLMKIEKGGYSNIEIDLSLRQQRLSDEDKALYTVLVYGVTERRTTLDWLIGYFGSRPAGKLDRDVLCLLRLGLYQIFYTDRIPDHAAVYETVELSKSVCRNWRAVTGYINAVLRSALRQKDDIKWPDESDDRVQSLSVRHSIPEWLVTMWLEDYPEHAEALMEYANQTPPLDIRVNTLMLSRGSLAMILAEKGISVDLPDDAPNCLTISDTPYSKLERFKSYFYVQDKASQIAAEAFGARPGERILDACAAPGGKTFYLAMRMNDSGEIIAGDLHENKLSKIRGTTSRLGISCVKAIRLDARRRDDSLGTFNRVLCDVPCSGLGSISKKPEIRYKSTDDISNLPKTQYEILDCCSVYLKTGGILMYSTCTVNKAENENVTGEFLENHIGFTVTEERTLYPDSDGCDGFYYCILKKN